jgi:hypothetical protein
MTDKESHNVRPHIHVVYEYGSDYRPHSSPFLRLIRPFSHPRVQAHIGTTFDTDYDSNRLIKSIDRRRSLFTV